MVAVEASTDPSSTAAATLKEPSAHEADRRLRRLLTLFLTILAGVAVVWVLWQVVGHLANVLVLLLVSVLLAFILAGPVEWLERRGLPRGAAIGLTFVGSLVVLIVVLALLLGPLVTQVGALVERLPEQIRDLDNQQTALDRYLSQSNLPVRATDLRQQALDRVTGMATGMIDSAPALLSKALAVFVDTVIALVLTCYLLLDGPRLRHAALRLTPARWRPWTFVVEAAMRKVVGGYLRGQLLVALVIGVSAGVGCWLLGVPFPLVIGVLSAVLELVPMIGPIMATVIAVAITLPQGFPQVLWVLLLFLGIHQVELNILGPRISGHAVGLHPAGALIALLVGLELGGVLGALVAVPTAGVLTVLAQAIYWERSGQTAPVAPVRQVPLVGLARRLAWRRPSVGPAPPAARQPDAGATTMVVTTTVDPRGTVEQPEAVAKLAEEAQQLHVAFEAAEAARLADQKVPGPAAPPNASG